MSKNVYTRYPIGTPGQAWGEAERAAWRATQPKKRDYFLDVVSRLHRFAGGDVFQYGSIDYRKYGFAEYPLYAVKSSNWDAARPLVLVTGGVHGYETSGVHGALMFIEKHFATYTAKVNLLVLPCISPWGYETINRWTPDAVDPNRSFLPRKPGCPEAANAMAVVMKYAQQSASVLMHTDLHETTDSDNLEFRPAKAARDGAELPPWDPIPFGYYLVSNASRAELEWHKAVIEAVGKVTKIADPDEKGEIIGEKVVEPGIIVIDYDGLCGNHTGAKYATTTETYPDAPGMTDDECNRAQVATILGGLEYALQHP